MELPSLANSKAFWVIAYFSANVLLTLQNKWILSKLEFSFPWSLTFLHIGISGFCSYLYMQLKIPKNKLASTHTSHSEDGALLFFSFETIKIISYSIIFTANIALSNISLNYVSLPFHQLVRSTNPIFVIILEYVFFQTFPRLAIVTTLAPIILGISLSSIGQFQGTGEASILGCVLTFSSVLIGTIKGLLTKVILVGPLKFHPLDLCWKIAPFCLILCVAFAWIQGEFCAFVPFFQKSLGSGNIVWILFSLTINGISAFFLNCCSLFLMKLTSPLTISVVGNVKQAVSITMGFIIFQVPVVFIDIAGIVITTVGGVAYRYVFF